jgi:hypothetical protein
VASWQFGKGQYPSPVVSEKREETKQLANATTQGAQYPTALTHRGKYHGTYRRHGPVLPIVEGVAAIHVIERPKVSAFDLARHLNEESLISLHLRPSLASNKSLSRFNTHNRPESTHSYAFASKNVQSNSMFDILIVKCRI